MKALVDNYRRDLESFVSSRDAFVLISSSSGPDAGGTTVILNSLDEESHSEFWWMVVDPFETPKAYVESCVQAFSTRYEAIRQVFAQDDESLPEIPNEISAEGLRPVERLRRLLIFSRSILPSLEGCKVVWAFVPMTIADPVGYAAFIAELSHHEMPFPWCHNIRMIVRDDLQNPAFTAFRGKPRIRFTQLDLSPESIRQSLETTAADDNVDLDERVNSLLLLAGINYSHAQHRTSIDEYKAVHRHASATNNPTLAAVALNGIGDNHRSLGENEKSGEYYEAALGAAGQAPGPPVNVLFNIYVNLGDLRYSEFRYSESDSYYRCASDMAYLMRDPRNRVDYWMKAGRAQAKNEQIESAVQTWSNAAVVSGRLSQFDQYQAAMSEIQTVYSAQGNSEAFTNTQLHIQQQIAEVQSDEQVGLEGNDGLS